MGITSAPPEDALSVIPVEHVEVRPFKRLSECRVNLVEQLVQQVLGDNFPYFLTLKLVLFEAELGIVLILIHKLCCQTLLSYPVDSSERNSFCVLP